MTYTPLPTGSAPTLGTSGAAVAALQTQYNTQNAGQPGYAPLKVDGLYGPLTLAATQYKAPAATGAPTIGQAYNIPTLQEYPTLTSARTAADNFNLERSTGGSGVDEASIRSNVLGQFQAENDAVNALYAQKLADAKVVGAGKLGSNTAIEARRGLLGSDFGAAQTDTVNKANEATYSGIQAEKNAAIQSILERARVAGDQAVKDKSAAIGAGLDAHLKYLEDAGTRKTTNATAAAQNIYDQKLDPSKLTTKELEQTATGYGVTPQDIINAFTAVKKTGDAKAAEAAAKALKDKLAGEKVIPQGAKVIDANGNVIARGDPKTFAPKSPKAPVPKVKSTYKNFTAKPSSANVSLVNGYITAHHGGAAALEKTNGDETIFYNVLNAAKKEAAESKKTGSASNIPVAPQ